MKRKYKGIVEDVYRFEIEVEADSTDEAIKKLKEMRASNGVEGVFIADARSYSRTKFGLKS